MNKRIAALKELATRKAMWPGDPDAGDLNAEKFAELIVRECAQLARDTNLEDVEGGDQSVLRAAKMQILEHFGVEE